MNTNVLEAVISGIKRSIRDWRLWVGVYIFNLMFAAVLSLPFAEIFVKDISRSFVGKDLMNGFNYKWFASFVGNNADFFKAFVPQVIFILTIYAFAEILFAGGFYSGYSGKVKMKFGEFLSRGTKFFFPLLAVTATECAILFSMFLLINPDLSYPPRELTAAPLFYYSIIPLVMIVSLFADFTRAAIVIDGDNLGNKIKHGVSFTILHPLSTTGVYACCLLISAVVPALYFAFYQINDSTTAEGIFIEIVFSQIFVLLRIFSKLIFYAAEAILYKENQIEVIKVKPEMLE
ncbi:MAG TPA: hypothetical protein VLX91_14485 [Candidatus Acidoferrales bacterium]|nr:hypothetical protein [Candidatus Acidoferrales bacterium]